MYVVLHCGTNLLFDFPKKHFLLLLVHNLHASTQVMKKKGQNKGSPLQRARVSKEARKQSRLLKEAAAVKCNQLGRAADGNDKVSKIGA